MQMGARGKMAFEAFWTRVSPALRRLIARYMYGASAEDREDMLQDLAVRFMVALPGFKGGICKPETWAYRVALNAIREKHRRAAHRATLPLEDVHAGPDPFRQVRARMTAMTMVSCISPRERRAITDKYIHGLTYEEMAGRYGETVRAIKTRTLRALRKARLNVHA